MTSNLEDSAQLGHRLAVFIDPDVHAWIFLVGVNNERGALAPALVAAGRLPRLQHRDQPLRQVERRLVEEVSAIAWIVASPTSMLPCAA